MSPATGVRDSRKSSEGSSTAELVIWMLAAGSVPFLVPLVAVLVLGPGFLALMVGVAWVVVAWLVLAYVGVAWVVAGGRLRGIGAAVIFGEALGLLLFAASVYGVFHHTNVGSN